MSFRDDGFAAHERADALQHELERSRVELDALRARLTDAPSRDAIVEREAELAMLREKLAEQDGEDRSRAAALAADARRFESRLTNVLMIAASLLLSLLLMSVRR